MQPNSEAILTELAAQGFTHAFELSLEDGTRIVAGAYSAADAHRDLIAAMHANNKRGTRPINSVEFSIKKYAVNTAPVLMASE
jgi:hypothetical protein